MRSGWTFRPRLVFIGGHERECPDDGDLCPPLATDCGTSDTAIPSKFWYWFPKFYIDFAQLLWYMIPFIRLDIIKLMLETSQ